MAIRMFLLFYITTFMNPIQLYKFDDTTHNGDWVVVDDGVMGGRSSGNFYINQQGNGVFEGRVSLDNNGGFSSLRHRLEVKNIGRYRRLVLRIKGDGGTYQFRIRDKLSSPHWYVAYFKCPNTWKTIKIPLSDMFPTFRGRKLDIPNYNGDGIQEIAFLIGNKKNESFKIEIDRIGLE